LAAALEGRTIFIDPGHGGPFTGMVAPSNGVHEADVNLSVALKLRAVLESHGAIVLMSRVDDRVPVPDNLSQDLAARAAMSNAARPDVFISIHHNADVEAGSQKDDLEVYYKRGDDVGSLDLGRALISALGRGIRFDAERKHLLPGNYKVLRLNDAPSLLLETAYLTNDRDAAYLKTKQGAEDEANSIAYGLATYFALDPPKAMKEGESPVIDSAGAQQFSVRFSSGLPIDLDTVAVYLDGENTGATIRGAVEGFDWLLRGPLPNGISTYDVFGQNMRGAGFHFRRTAHVDRPTAVINIVQRPPVAAPGNRVLFAVSAWDAAGARVADGTPITIDIQGQSLKTINGFANFYVDTEEIPKTFAITCENLMDTVAPIRIGGSHCTVSIHDARTGEPVSNAILWSGTRVEGTTNADGWIALPLNGGPYRAQRAGFETKVFNPSESDHMNIALSPQLGGVLLGRRIAIDPAHGGRVPGVVAPDGSRACDMNLDIAQRLAHLLERSGASAMLTRSGDDEVTDLQRINTTEPFRADVLLTISFGAPVEQTRPLDPVGHLRRDLTAFVGHYPQSVNGIRVATAISEALGVQKTACVSYMVQQSQSAAVHVQPASLDMRLPGDAPFDANALRGIAESIHQGLVTYFTEMDLES
jgi:N-acetylmuramoyl-L-alanine amidase